MELKLYSLEFRNSRTYLVAGIFILANIVLPQLFHLVPQGGITWLPIYFFTLVAAYKYGWKAGLLTALLSARKLYAFRNADGGVTSRHYHQVGPSCRSGRFRSVALP